MIVELPNTLDLIELSSDDEPEEELEEKLEEDPMDDPEMERPNVEQGI